MFHNIQIIISKAAFQTNDAQQMTNDAQPMTNDAQQMTNDYLFTLAFPFHTLQTMSSSAGWA